MIICVIVLKSSGLISDLDDIFCHHFRVGLQVVDVSDEVLLMIAFVEVAETTEHKLGFFE
jgi:hypothetical protein